MVSSFFFPPLLLHFGFISLQFHDVICPAMSCSANFMTQLGKDASADAYFVWEALEGGASWAALLGGLEAADDVLECRRHDKVLLLQTKLLSFKELEASSACRAESSVNMWIRSKFWGCRDARGHLPAKIKLTLSLG